MKTRPLVALATLGLLGPAQVFHAQGKDAGENPTDIHARKGLSRNMTRG